MRHRIATCHVVDRLDGLATAQDIKYDKPDLSFVTLSFGEATFVVVMQLILAETGSAKTWFVGVSLFCGCS